MAKSTRGSWSREWIVRTPKAERRRMVSGSSRRASGGREKRDEGRKEETERRRDEVEQAHVSFPPHFVSSSLGRRGDRRLCVSSLKAAIAQALPAVGASATLAVIRKEASASATRRQRLCRPPNNRPKPV